MGGVTLTARQTAYLIRLYHEAKKTVDRLPYTQTIATMANRMSKKFSRDFYPAELYHNLMSLRKSKQLIRIKTKP